MAKCSLLFLLTIPAVLGLLVPSSMARTVLNTGDSLFAGQSLTRGNYNFVMQTDCNLVLYDTSRAVWASGTNGRGSGCRATMQSDGNFVVYTSSGNAVWASGTNRGQGNYILILQQDRNVVVYIVNGAAIWATGTNVRGTPDAVIAKNTTDAAVPVAAADHDLGNRKVAVTTKN